MLGVIERGKGVENMVEETFIVKIKQCQNATWQGSVEWIGNNGKKMSQSFFRSALELICLMDSAVSGSEYGLLQDDSSTAEK